ncbi:EF-hand domain-containing protein [Streptomyces sp. NPDC002138]
MLDVDGDGVISRQEYLARPALAVGQRGGGFRGPGHRWGRAHRPR